MTFKLFLTRLVSASLLLSALVFAACGSDSPAAPGENSGDIPSPLGTNGDLSVEEIVSLAISASNSTVSHRTIGQYTIKADGEALAAQTLTREWSSGTERKRTLIRSESPSETGELEMIQIGDRMYTRNSAWGQEWQEGQTDPFDANENSFKWLAELSEASITGTETVSGVTAYRIEGTPAEPALVLPQAGSDSHSDNARDTVFISTSDYRVVRFERTASVKASADYIASFSGATVSPMTGEEAETTETVVYTVTMTVDIEYFSESLVIERPEHYIALPEEDDSQPHTPTSVSAPVTATATPTAAPRPGGTGPLLIPTFAPDDPRRHLPLFLEDTPSYDKLELGNDVVVSYPQCNKSSIGFRWGHTVIYYMKDGSFAANWTVADASVEEEDDGAPDDYTYFEFDHVVYRSEEGRAALDAVLSDPELVNHILEHSARPARCPAEFVEEYREDFDSPPDYDKFVIDEDTVAFFESCDTEYDEHVAPIVIEHFPTESAIAITPGEPGFEHITIGTPSGSEWLEQVVEDEAVLEQIMAMAPREARCG